MFVRFKRYLKHGLCFINKKIDKYTYTISFLRRLKIAMTIKVGNATAFTERLIYVYMNNAYLLSSFLKSSFCNCFKVKNQIDHVPQTIC